jgi:hypothetical protein
MGKKLIGSAALTPSSDSGFDLDTKGQIHGYTTTQYALDVGTNNQVLTSDSTTASGLAWKDSSTVTPITSFIVALTAEDGDATVADNLAQIRMPFAFTLTSVRAFVNTAPTGSGMTFDITESSSSVLSTLITIDATEKTSTTAATPPVISDTSLADDSIIGFNCDAIGSTVAGAGVKLVLIGYRTI